MNEAKLALAQTLMMAMAFQSMEKDLWKSEGSNDAGFYKPCLTHKRRTKRKKNKRK